MTAYDVGLPHDPPRLAMTLFTEDEVLRFWPGIERMLDTVPNTWRYWTKDSIYDAIMSNRMQVWGVGEPPRTTFVMFTEVNVLPAMRVLAIVWGAGMFDDAMLPLIESVLVNYAQLNGCEEIEIRGRLGWEPKWRQIGLERQYSVWVKRVPKINLN